MSHQNDPAFPRPGFWHPEAPNDSISYPEDGMTLRAYVAATALQGILANPHARLDEEDAATSAVIHADALLAALAAKGRAR